MDKFINNQRFIVELLDGDEVAERAGEIGAAILETRSLRLTDIAVKTEGESATGYKRIQRFLQKADPRTALWRLFQEDAEFVIGDPTEIERPHAWKTEYVGKLKDGKTRGLIEETYRDLKSLLGLTKLMNKQQVYMEKMVSLLLLIFTIGLLVGEELCDLLYGEPIAENEHLEDTQRIPGSPFLKKGKKWKRYSGLFVLLKQKWTLSHEQKTVVLDAALSTFRSLVYPNVRTFV